MFLLKRTSKGGGYVGKPGHKSSYVKNLKYARKFQTIEEANDHRCEQNEVIINLERLLDELRY